ncbi:MAG: hypothetical protein L0Y64_16285 [Myxococcaceae bacterium]|nr:hypothetical protein [Myxococcaceae bacterium]
MSREAKSLLGSRSARARYHARATPERKAVEAKYPAILDGFYEGMLEAG